ncbi:MAG TPA: hypothetical protein VMD02_07255 [Candidatus Omnitrophota bacterium]|nr:hypothetical protein [Candidatus Omnitrophota bacterium]
MILQSVVLLIIGIVIGLALFFFLGRAIGPHTAQMDVQSRTYSDAEIENILARNGYKLKGKGEKATLTAAVDGQTHMNVLVADFIAEKEKDRFVVYVKVPGELDPLAADLRRKLIELDYAFSPRAVLLVDPVSGGIQKVSFALQGSERDNFMRFFIPLFIILVIIGIIGLFVLIRLV